MKPIALAEVLSLEDYERTRARVRRRLLALKERRRVSLGENLLLLFENRDTVWYQIQEMIRIERMIRRDQIAHEVRTYNGLLPRLGELSATLLIQFEDPAERDRRLRELLGLERAITLCVGDRPPVPATFDPTQVGTDRLSSVQFLRFRFGAGARGDWSNESRRGGIRFVVDHPAYRATTVVDAAIAHELGKDLETATSDRGTPRSRRRVGK